MFYLDPLYFMIVGPAILLAMWAQYKVKSAYKNASEITSHSGLTGAEAARKMLESAGLTDVKIEETTGFLSDHYDPRDKKLALSPDVYSGNSLASVGIACHEAGHAIQDAKGYRPLVLRNAIVPMASIGSWLSFPLIFAGIIFHMAQLFLVGIVVFAGVAVFQLINLPVEFNASTRAKQQLANLAIIHGPEEQEGVNKVLNAAAMTYVAATITALAQLLYFIILFSGRR